MGLTMELFEWLKTPAIILSCIGVISVFLKIGRKDKTLEDHGQTIKNHALLLKELGERKLLTESHCKAEQERCMKIQGENNSAIMESISELKKEVRGDRETSHAELMKITKSVGRIEGIISRLRFNKDGELT